jgi:pimeloyl-ACP methyl ester carboxylesterase
MWLLALLLVTDSTAHTFPVVVSAAETIQVTVTGMGQPVVLLPSLFGCASCYNQMTRLLTAGGYQTIMIEALGIGTAGRPPAADYSLTAQTDRIADALDQIGIVQAVFVAHTIGASLAYRLAYRRPDLVRGVVSLDGGAAEEAATPGFRRALKFIPWVKWFGGLRLIRKKIRDELVRDSRDPAWVTEAVVTGFTAGPERDLDGTLRAYVAMGKAHEGERLEPHLRDIHCPIVLLIGAAVHKGGIGDEELAMLTRELPHLRVDRVPDAGLYVYAEQPQAVFDAVHAMSLATALSEPENY